MINVNNKKIIRINNKLNKIPRKVDLNEVLKQFKRDKDCSQISLNQDNKLPYRPGISLSRLNKLVQQCHNTIRKIEKNEETAFADFSKFLFLKLLEEKWDSDNSENAEQRPYSYTFDELAQYSQNEADRVKDAINSMILSVSQMRDYGEVLNTPINLKQNITYLKIVQALSKVSFSDCDLDSKGAAFEYFVRATLKGKKLGQYFTPRPLVKLMLSLGQYNQIVSSLLIDEPFKVIDPACGTGGFLVSGLNQCQNVVEQKFKNEEINNNAYEKLIKKLRKEVFYGIDANEGVASSAKMNMIIAGDGHSNIRWLDSLKQDKLIPDYRYGDDVINDGKAHLILSNPPFGTSERESLGEYINNYEIPSGKGQSLFIQQMIKNIKDNGRIVTVIDDGLLNTESNGLLREHILKNCKLEAIVSLPDETFKPNKINVKSSVMVLKKYEELDENLQADYDVKFIQIESLGYDGSGETIRNFDERKLIECIKNADLEKLSEDKFEKGYYNKKFKINIQKIIEDKTFRFDLKYWNPDITYLIKKISKSNAKTILDVNEVDTSRGKSPKAEDYVNKKDGFALVIKAGSNISKSGNLIIEGDYIEEDVFIETKDKLFQVFDGDILLSSTGEGTLGKCCVYRNKDENNKSKPAIADGHVTVIRVDDKKIYPEFLCDYLRVGLGAKQIERLYTGSTGLIELTPGDVDRIILPEFEDISIQKKKSKSLRKKEETVTKKIEELKKDLEQNNKNFYESFIENLTEDTTE